MFSKRGGGVRLVPAVVAAGILITSGVKAGGSNAVPSLGKLGR